MKTIDQLIEELQAIKNEGNGQMIVRFSADVDEAYDIDGIFKETNPDNGEEYYCIE